MSFIVASLRFSVYSVCVEVCVCVCVRAHMRTCAGMERRGSKTERYGFG